MKRGFVKSIQTIGLSFAILLSSTYSWAEASLYERLGGYDAISAVVDDVVQQIASDKKLGRFWAHRGDDGITREKQLIVDFIVHKAGGPLYYTGREMKLSHQGMKIDQEDWDILITALKNTLLKFQVPTQETQEVLEFFDSTRQDIVEINS
ncbi:group 1 truncated hemoglobin [uncultured Neptuniibacter sp.]|uniref:group I truncated hemoglobin n=1 Tax=uncultured Neptuniibacter sp. TaxID=502143 RepID=UPI00260C4860|nr:group 1 truncated hemoglobin [uncultured Neptuniibacter sp.]